MKKTKICIITARNIYDSPCLEKYERLIPQSCDIVFWDRHGIEEKCFAANQYKYNGVIDPNANKVAKAKHYVLFAKHVNQVLKKNDYECLIIYPSHTAWLMLPLLCRKYKNRYVLDIRDYSGENNPIIYFMTKQAIDHSGLCSITSKAYEHFLPKHDYVISHNIQSIDAELIQDYRKRERKEGKPIVLSFIGTIRFIDQQKRIIKCFEKDNRFLLQFIGRGSEQLELFCKENEIKNVVLKGRFERTELSKYYMETDMAINVYGNNDPFLDYALSNKLYSAALMGMPILCSPKTYMAEVSEKYGFGFSLDLDDETCTDRLYDYYMNTSLEKIYSGCDNFIHDVFREEEIYSRRLRNYLNQF